MIREFECRAGRKPALFNICKFGLYKGLVGVYGMGRDHVQHVGRQLEKESLAPVVQAEEGARRVDVLDGWEKGGFVASHGHPS